MTWGAILRQLLADPLAWLFAAIVGIAGATGGYFYGQHTEATANEAKQSKALTEALQRARTAEAKIATEVQGVSNDYEVKISNLNRTVAAANVELGRLRVKPRCSMPTSAASPGESNAAAEGQTNGDRTGEINLDGIAGKIIELGGDLDAANIRITSLQDLVSKYEKACKVDLP